MISRNILCLLLSLILCFKSNQAKAEFMTAWIVVGVIIGITAAEISHKNQCEEK